MGLCVMKMLSWMVHEPLTGCFIIVDIEIVQDNMEFTEGIGLHPVIHETQKVHRRAAVADMRDDFASGYFEGCQERLRTMPDILVGPGADLFRSQGRPRLSSVEVLNTGV